MPVFSLSVAGATSTIPVYRGKPRYLEKHPALATDLSLQQATCKDAVSDIFPLTLTTRSRKRALPGLLVVPVSTKRRGDHRNLVTMSIASAA